MHLREMYRDNTDKQRTELIKKYMIIGGVLWLVALCLLIYYWNTLELWAKVVGIIGLLYNYCGFLLTMLVVLVGSSNKIIDTQSTTPTTKIPTVPEIKEVVSVPVPTIVPKLPEVTINE
jgi:hypothetical protein